MTYAFTLVKQSAHKRAVSSYAVRPLRGRLHQRVQSHPGVQDLRTFHAISNPANAAVFSKDALREALSAHEKSHRRGWLSGSDEALYIFFEHGEQCADPGDRENQLIGT